MARVDSILSILAHQGANELRLGTDREPKLFAHGVPKRLSIPSTSEDTLRLLLGEILTPERDAALRAHERVEATYDAAGIGPFQIRITTREGGGFDALFLRAPSAAARPRPEPAASHDAPPPAASAASRVPLAHAPDHAPATRASEASTPELAAEASPALAELVAGAFALRASDIHLAHGEPPMVRVDGRLRRLHDAPVDLEALLDALGGTDARLRQSGSGRGDGAATGASSSDAAIDLPGLCRARVHAFRAAEGLAMAIRLLPSATPSLASLNLPVPLHDLVALTHGLVLVCGATGSGKSTTLASLAQEALDRRSIAVVTLEDPIELGLHPSEASIIRRREVGRDVKDFAAGLRDALREDPDVILVGEMRDPETIGLALTAAETGHLVLSSLHSGSTASAVERIVDAYPPARQAQIRVQLADSLRAVVAQRLLPRVRGAGRVPAVEVLRVTHAVAALIREGKTAQIATALQSGKREGMIAMERSLADRVQAGDVRPEDAMAAANDVESLRMLLSK